LFPLYSRAAARHEPALRADRTFNLIVRLRHSVIRTGLRRVSLAYSRISLADVATKLGLPSAEDAEFVVAKAIRDGAVDAVIDREEGVVRSARAAGVYLTAEPQAAFHARIAFCMDVHNEAVRAMRFAPGERHRFDDATKLRGRQEQELQAALEEDDMEF
jgi:26S proteasome regulatory subunit N3